MPCPEGIDVPRIFELYNDAFIYEDVETARAIIEASCTTSGVARNADYAKSVREETCYYRRARSGAPIVSIRS